MTDIETRLRETLAAVASTTTARDRLGETLDTGDRRGAGRVVIAGFALVVLAIGLPALLGSMNEGKRALGAPGTTVAPPSAPATLPPASQVTAPGGFVIPPANSWGPPTGMVDAAAGLDPTWFTVEPTDLADIPETASGEPYLRTNEIWCAFADGSVTRGVVHTTRFGDDATEVDLYTACEERRNGGPEVMPATMTFCRAVAEPPSEMVETGQYGIVAGSLTVPKPGFVIGLGWESDCVSEELATNPKVSLHDDLDLEAINRTRQMEIAITSAAVGNCLGYNEAHAVAAETRRLLGEEWVHVYVPLLTPESGDCYRPWFEPETGSIVVWGR